MIPTPNFFDTTDVSSLQPYFNVVFDVPMKDENILKLYQSEIEVLTYFIEEEPAEQPLGAFAAFPVALGRPQLKGYVGTVETPEINEMDQPLIEAIKQSIVNVFESKDEKMNIKRLQQGDRTVVFKDTLTKRDLKPLMIYDSRSSFTYL